MAPGLRVLYMRESLMPAGVLDNAAIFVDADDAEPAGDNLRLAVLRVAFDAPDGDGPAVRDRLHDIASAETPFFLRSDFVARELQRFKVIRDAGGSGWCVVPCRPI